MPDPPPWIAPFAEIFADLKLSFGRVADEMAQARLAEQDRLAKLPNYVNDFRYFTPVGGVTQTVLDFGAPQNGREWIVRDFGVITGDLSVQAAVVAGLYVGQYVLTDTAGGIPLNYLRWQFVSVPQFKTMGSDSVKVRANERLLVGLTSMPAGKAFGAVVCYNEQPMRVSRPVTTE